MWHRTGKAQGKVTPTPNKAVTSRRDSPFRVHSWGSAPSGVSAHMPYRPDMQQEPERAKQSPREPGRKTHLPATVPLLRPLLIKLHTRVCKRNAQGPVTGRY